MTEPRRSSDVAALRIVALSGAFGGRRVVNEVDLEVHDGEILTLVGPSGCGKSTLTRLIAGLDTPASGQVFLGGVDVTAVSAERRRIGLVFQDAALFGHLRVGDNIGFGLSQLSGAERKVRIAEMLEIVGLSHLARRYPHELSGGEQQRIALARALAPRPRVLLLDEPFANLDEVLRDALRHQVADILRATRTASILVTHDRVEAMSLGDNVAVMSQGCIVQCDAPRTVYARPVDRFVASFMGEATFLPTGDGAYLVARPHNVSVGVGGEDLIERVEFLGARCRYEIRRRDGSLVVGEGDSATLFSVGDRCTVRIETSHLHRIVK